MQIIVVVIARLGACVLSRVITAVIVKFKDAQKERVQDAETLFLSRRLSMEHEASARDMRVDDAPYTETNGEGGNLVK